MVYTAAKMNGDLVKEANNSGLGLCSNPHEELCGPHLSSSSMSSPRSAGDYRRIDSVKQACYSNGDMPISSVHESSHHQAVSPCELQAWHTHCLSPTSQHQVSMNGSAATSPSEAGSPTSVLTRDSGRTWDLLDETAGEIQKLAIHGGVNGAGSAGLQSPYACSSPPGHPRHLPSTSPPVSYKGRAYVVDRSGQLASSDQPASVRHMSRLGGPARHARMGWKEGMRLHACDVDPTESAAMLKNSPQYVAVQQQQQQQAAQGYHASLRSPPSIAFQRRCVGGESRHASRVVPAGVDAYSSYGRSLKAAFIDEQISLSHSNSSRREAAAGTGVFLPPCIAGGANYRSKGKCATAALQPTRLVDAFNVQQQQQQQDLEEAARPIAIPYFRHAPAATAAAAAIARGLPSQLKRAVYSQLPPAQVAEGSCRPSRAHHAPAHGAKSPPTIPCSPPQVYHKTDNECGAFPDEPLCEGDAIRNLPSEWVY